MPQTACPFCDPDPERVFYRGTRVYALWDAFPVTEGHALIVTHNHVRTWFDATREEQSEILSALTIAREAILAGRAGGRGKDNDNEKPPPASISASTSTRPRARPSRISTSTSSRATKTTSRTREAA